MFLLGYGLIKCFKSGKASSPTNTNGISDPSLSFGSTEHGGKFNWFVKSLVTKFEFRNTLALLLDRRHSRQCYEAIVNIGKSKQNNRIKLIVIK